MSLEFSKQIFNAMLNVISSETTLKKRKTNERKVTALVIQPDEIVATKSAQASLSAILITKNIP